MTNRNLAGRRGLYCGACALCRVCKDLENCLEQLAERFNKNRKILNFKGIDSNVKAFL